MTPEQFCYWLQGFAELSKDTPPTPEQWKSICEHIGTVFKKITPPVSSTVHMTEEQLLKMYKQGAISHTNQSNPAISIC